ncbi:DUF4091 domain-containing protein [Chitinophaga sp. Cy-1792]|uniref:DUF4091 domain-containing protein n=1 Tax=Chitinophaga sp. Cy-1792 TaxID=2608339 RepID=UPI001420890E|nr:DUF4091 domain-containing protein [Chitinophaga sp. Cy-1792]NIG53193.1 DUF4091 domain-containing protein [Chitinophaga sp. Cy-1792]
MVNKFFGVLLLLALQQNAWAQNRFAPDYKDLPDPRPVNEASWQPYGNALQVAFGNTDTRYEKRNAPAAGDVTATWTGNAWKGERVQTQLLIWSAAPVAHLSVKILSLKNQSYNFPANAVKAGFVRYVMTDELNKDGSGCGYRKPENFDSSLVADGIDAIASGALAAKTTQPVWITIQVPENTPAGTYEGIVEVNGDKSTTRHNFQLKVSSRTLAAPDKWKFHLDLWQSPDAVARMYNVKPWSKEHFEAMRPYMKMLAAAGQKVITATLIYDPWNAQTEDIYSTMIKWTKKKNGSWTYDYGIFDQWVTYMMGLGIKDEINCYSMIPWNLKFHYYDESAAKDTFIIAKPGTPEYTAHWLPMLKDFVKHLKAKGWYNITTIAMDERPSKDMQEALKVIRTADKDFKLSLAGSYHAPLAYEIWDYCIASGEQFPADVMKERLKKGWPTTFYTCCTEGFPNTFTFSPPAEATFMGWYAAAKGYTGYLRWAFNSWVKNPLTDSRFRSWAAGDTYFIYPGPRTSIRFEKLVEGVQDFEKIRTLKAEFEKNHDNAKLNQLEEILQSFEINTLKTTPAANIVNAAKAKLNAL